MKARLILEIVSLPMEEAAIVVIVRWGLPQIGVHIPIPGLIALMIAWGTYSVITYRIGSRALRKKPLINLPDMVGSKGEVVSPLAPAGMVKIKGELWVAKSAGGEIQVGEQIVVVGQARLKLVVCPDGATRDSEKAE